MTDCVGIVIVSHSPDVARGAADMVHQMVGVKTRSGEAVQRVRPQRARCQQQQRLRHPIGMGGATRDVDHRPARPRPEPGIENTARQRPVKLQPD